MKLLNSLRKICFTVSTLIVINVHAGTTTWQWNLSTATLDGSTISSNGTNQSDSNILNADLTAFADTGGYNDQILQQSDALPEYSGGWGMVNQDDNWGTPNHAFDNENDYDMALVSFDTSVELTEVGFSWVYGDYTDFTVLAYTGTDTPTLAGNTWSGIASEWTLIGSYRADDPGYYSINTDGISSEYWLVGAFNDILDTDYDDGWQTDAFKLKGLKGNTSTSHEEVSEPAALGLMLLGMFGLYARRNKTLA